MNTQPETTTTTLTGPPDTLRRALAAAALYASSDHAGRPHLARVNLTAKHIEATDSYHAARITSPEITTEPGQIPAEIVDRIVRELDQITKATKRTSSDRTASIQLDATTGAVRIAVHNEHTELARAEFTAFPWETIHYPDTTSLYNQKIEPDTRATFSPHVISHLAKITTTLAGSKKAAELVGIRFHRINPTKPARITITTADGLTADIIAMPMRDEWPTT